MAQYRNDSEYGYNGALPGRIIETEDVEYAKILVNRGFTRIDTENTETSKENVKPQENTEEQTENTETSDKKQKIKKIV